jgi:hypothetical protein
LVDLPGLGDLAAGVRDIIAGGLRGDVDAIIQLMRAADGLANINPDDIAAFDVALDAMDGVDDSRDFCWAVINTSETDSSRISALEVQITQNLNNNCEGSRVSTLVADVRDATDVHEKVLLPILERLTERIDVIDSQLEAAAVADARRELVAVDAANNRLTQALSHSHVTSPNELQLVIQKAKRLRSDFQQAVADVDIKEIVKDAQLSYRNKLDAIHNDVLTWLEDGLGLPGHPSKIAWLEEALRWRGLYFTNARFTIDEVLRIRSSITRKFSAIGDH